MHNRSRQVFKVSRIANVHQNICFLFNILTRSAHKMKQSIIMNVQWDISMPMPCLNGMPIAALNNPFIKAHNWIQAEPSIDSSFSSHKYIPNYHDNTYHHYLLQCRSIGSIGIFCFPKSLFPFFCFRVLSSIPRLTQLQQYFLDGSEEFNILKVVLVPSQKENRVIHRVKKKGRREGFSFHKHQNLCVESRRECLKGTT